MKYYTPKIEEFHVGFEYEENTLSGWNTKIMTWNDYPSYAGDYIGEGLQEDRIRVKYLDREDIESLNFTDYRHSTNDWYKMIVDFSIGNIPFKAIRLSHNYDDNIISIMGYEYVFEMENATQETQLFYGKINNVSEFKILLKQLNIL